MYGNRVEVFLMYSHTECARRECPNFKALYTLFVVCIMIFSATQIILLPEFNEPYAHKERSSSDISLYILVGYLFLSKLHQG